MGILDTLLEVQERDLALDRLAHRRATLPERQTLAELDAGLARVGEREAEVQATRGALGDRERRLEADADATAGRIGDIEARLYGGVVSAPRELSAMSEEVVSLRRRRSELEDQAIAVMEEAEPLDAALADLAEERGGLEAERARVSAAIAEAEAAIAEEEAAERRAREDHAAHLPADLANQYEALRARLGGVGAARLVHGSCTGCHLTLPASEQERLRHLPPDDVATCDQCGRILVR